MTAPSHDPNPLLAWLRDTWCGERPAEEWQEIWRAVADEIDPPTEYWLIYRSFGGRSKYGLNVSPNDWCFNPNDSWEELTSTLELACTSQERRYILNDVLWGWDYLFPQTFRFGDPTLVAHAPHRLEWMLNYAVGDHEARGDLLWNIIGEEKLMPADFDLPDEEIDEFLRRFPTPQAWDAIYRELGGEAFSTSYDDLPATMHCAAAVVAYKDRWYGDSKLHNRIAAARALRRRLGGLVGSTPSTATQ